ncbi:uncharacterized protein YndB with AHSA1/START domain [Variovorax paradoxus]|uniref:SRPBCC family protein n=1 Tax=Variovorax paradoxus TaxID=34073 RepID=UPI00278D8987|nr:SRPBCC family protein [Variovorax paradoxus]MDQ0568448.1 uncharacterized protein YndB with AHSA1/START domain [Variovorax paradoxus]
MLKTIALAVLALIAALLIFAATRPDTFRVERTARIQAPAEKIFPLIGDFHRWGTWSPYEKLDPEMKREFGGTPSGKGATYAWDSKGKAGAGRMEIMESSPSSRIAIKLDFIKPFEGHNTAEFTLKPEGDATQVTWAMYGPNPYVAKLMGIFFNMDQMIGKDFEAGLASLKTATEK